MVTDDGDAEIIKRILQGEVDAFSLLVEKHKKQVAAIVRTHVPYNCIEEVAQDVFVDAFKSLPNYRAESPFAHWLSVIAVRRCCDFLRKRQRNREVPVGELYEEQAAWLETVVNSEALRTHMEAEQANHARAVLAWALDRLAPDDRIVLGLVHLDNYSIKDAAEILGWTVPTVKVRAFRSRKKLRKLIEEFLTKDEGNEKSKG